MQPGQVPSSDLYGRRDELLFSVTSPQYADVLYKDVLGLVLGPKIGGRTASSAD